MIILFGSYARGDFVEYDQKTTKEGIKESYQSDFDILVIVRKKKTEKNSSLWQNIEASIRNNLAIRTPFRMIVDQLDFVNEKLKQGRYFYADIYKEGVMLYSSNEFELNKPTPQENLEPKEKLKQAKEYFKKCLKSAKEFYIAYELMLDKRFNNKSAFNLHQTIETLFNTILLTFTGYTPKVHNLEELNGLVAKIDERFKDVFPKQTKKEQDLFELLKKAYVDARYSLSYKINKTQLKSLENNIKELETLTKAVCEEKIKELQTIIKLKK